MAAAAPNRGRTRNYCVTINNWTRADKKKARRLRHHCTYLVIGKEVGAAGTKHLQCFFVFKNTKTWSAAKRMGNPGWHWEAMRGKQAEAARYCQKEDEDAYEFGRLVGQGMRRDLDEARVVALGPGGMRELSQFGTYQQCKVGMICLEYNGISRDSSQEMDVTWLWGDTGTGKTRRAMAEAKVQGDRDGTGVYLKMSEGKWFPGYDGQLNLIIDDIRPDWFKFTELLHLLDRHPVRVELKGSHRQMQARRIWLTSIQAPQAMFSAWLQAGEPVQQLLRRIHHIICLDVHDLDD